MIGYKVYGLAGIPFDTLVNISSICIPEHFSICMLNKQQAERNYKTCYACCILGSDMSKIYGYLFLWKAMNVTQYVGVGLGGRVVYTLWYVPFSERGLGYILTIG